MKINTKDPERLKNIFENIPGRLKHELSEELIKSESVRIERIVSRGHKSPEDFWYDQDENEWVILLKGSAVLSFKEDNKTVRMKVGDFFNIPAHQKHRVEQTAKNEDTIWLCIFYG